MQPLVPALDPLAALAWLQRCVDRGEGGKTLLVGFRDASPEAAWAAGLRGEQDHPHFITFARYALQGLHACNGYWLMLPAQLHATRGYRCRLKTRARGIGLEAWQERSGWSFRQSEEPDLLEDLLLPGPKLPGVLRRDLDALADRLKIEPPSVD
jgi:hypothetical protein